MTDPRIEAMTKVWFDSGYAQEISVDRDTAALLLAAADAVDPVRADLLTTRVQLSNAERELARSREAGLRMVDNVCAQRDALQAALIEIRRAAEARYNHTTNDYVHEFASDLLEYMRAVAAAMEGKANEYR